VVYADATKTSCVCEGVVGARLSCCSGIGSDLMSKEDFSALGFRKEGGSDNLDVELKQEPRRGHYVAGKKKKSFNAEMASVGSATAADPQPQSEATQPDSKDQPL